MIAASVTTLTLASCSWSSTRFDPARTAHNPASGISSDTVGTLRPAWRVPNVYLYPSPGLVADGVVVTSYGGRVDAYDGADGSSLWSHALGGPAVVGGTLYGTRSVASGGSGYTLVALDLRTGKTRWSETSSAAGAPSRHSGTVVAADGDSVFVHYSLGDDPDASYGLDVWDAPTRHVRWSEDFAGDPAVADGVVYTYNAYDSATIHVREVVARDESTGYEIWSKPVARPCFGDSGPVVAGAYLFVVGETRRVSDGSVERTWPACPVADVAVDGRTVFALSTTSATGRLEAFDGVTGAVRWTAMASTPPIVSDDLVLAGAGSAVVAYDEATGHARGLVGLGRGNTATSYPIAADGLLLVASDDPGAGLKAWRPQSP